MRAAIFSSRCCEPAGRVVHTVCSTLYAAYCVLHTVCSVHSAAPPQRATHWPCSKARAALWCSAAAVQQRRGLTESFYPCVSDMDKLGRRETRIGGQLALRPKLRRDGRAEVGGRVPVWQHSNCMLMAQSCEQIRANNIGHF